MLASSLDFFLPPERIAQTPIEPRDAARLLVMGRGSGTLAHHRVTDLPGLLRPDDLLVFNNSRVLRARLQGRRQHGGQAEALLLKEVQLNQWECLLKPSARMHVGEKFTLGPEENPVFAVPLERRHETWLVQFSARDGADVRQHLERVGQVPLPPYIKLDSSAERYQTVYARTEPPAGEAALDSAAAPTAGLHFTPQLLTKLHESGIATEFVTLAVGVGTFKPVKAHNLEDHRMHAEEYWIPPSTAVAIAAQKARGGRVVAVGTTTVRALESACDAEGLVRAGDGSTDIFIQPGHRFCAVDALLTNFHLPRSTLLALVGAFIGGRVPAQETRDGVERLLEAYREAIENEYRFFSFGDAMLIQ